MSVLNVITLFLSYRPLEHGIIFLYGGIFMYLLYLLEQCAFNMETSVRCCHSAVWLRKRLSSCWFLLILSNRKRKLFREEE